MNAIWVIRFCLMILTALLSAGPCSAASGDFERLRRAGLKSGAKIEVVKGHWSWNRFHWQYLDLPFKEPFGVTTVAEISRDALRVVDAEGVAYVVFALDVDLGRIALRPEPIHQAAGHPGDDCSRFFLEVK